MIRCGPMKFFSPTHSNGTRTGGIVIAALHHKWSLTWRWILSWDAPQPIAIAGHRYPRIYGIRVHRGRGLNFIAGIRVPLLGHFAIHTQPNMRRKQKSGEESDATCDPSKSTTGKED